MWRDNLAGKLATITSHPVLAGEQVTVKRSDPFKQFVIVTLARRVGNYRAGDDIRLAPDQIETKE